MHRFHQVLDVTRIDAYTKTLRVLDLMRTLVLSKVTITNLAQRVCTAAHSIHTVRIKWKGPLNSKGTISLACNLPVRKGRQKAKEGWGEQDQEMYKQRFHLRVFRYLQHSVHVKGYWQKPLCTHQLAGSIMKPKHQSCGFFFPWQLTEMIQSNLLFLIGKVLAPDLHGKICIAFFSASSHFYDFEYDFSTYKQTWKDKVTSNMTF